MGERIKVSLLLKIARELQDVVQAIADPSKTDGLFDEIGDLAPILWNMGEDYPIILDHIPEVLGIISTFGSYDTLEEYLSGKEWVEWDVELGIFSEDEEVE